MKPKTPNENFEFENLEDLEDLYDYNLGMEVLNRIQRGEEDTSPFEDVMDWIGNH